MIDSSALVAIIDDEPERRAFIDAIVDHGDPRISAATYLETSIVLEARLGARGADQLDTLLQDVGIEIVAFDSEQAKMARSAFRRFGKGRHRAGLNFGDCFSYALAKSLDAPLLFKGKDFSQTDLMAAL